jgi:hypothetical protein
MADKALPRITGVALPQSVRKKLNELSRIERRNITQLFTLMIEERHDRLIPKRSKRSDETTLQGTPS